MLQMTVPQRSFQSRVAALLLLFLFGLVYLVAWYWCLSSRAPRSTSEQPQSDVAYTTAPLRTGASDVAIILPIGFDFEKIWERDFLRKVLSAFPLSHQNKLQKLQKLQCPSSTGATSS